MICCDNLIHPFQHDPGVSQRQRVIEDLLSGLASIDGRTMAALLNYFTQLSRQVNYYDAKLNVSDWQPFFKKSIPFSLAAIIQYDKSASQKKIDKYNRLFDKRPNPHSLQLIIHFIYNHTIRQINQWHKEVKGSELPAERVIEKLIKDKLSGPVNNFLCLTNFAVQKYKISKLDISQLMENDTWNLPLDEITNTNCFTPAVSGKRKRLIALRNEIVNLLPGFLSSISLAGTAAELSMDQSLFPLKEELQKKHTPHLALLFAFLKLFNHLQGDLNSYTKKHLDFFYQDVLKLKPRSAVADKAHVIFEIQKQLDKYLLKKNLQVKDGKDNKKAEIYFATDDEIVVNKTEVADVRTLFLNNQLVYNTSYTEGVYIAPDARKADGVKIDFKDGGPVNWPTIGSKYSKYFDPEQKKIRPYPPARMGFILASPVLLLNEGTRTIHIQLACILDKQVCDNIQTQGTNTDSCCSSANNTVKEDPCKPATGLPVDAEAIIDNVNKALKRTYCFVSQLQVDEAEKKGIDKEIVKKIKKRFLTNQCYKPICCENEKKYIPETFVRYGVWLSFLNLSVPNQADQKMLNEIFTPRRIFKIYFSGEKEWIQPEPDEIIDISLTKPAGNDRFLLSVKIKLKADKPAVTFYNKEKLKEDFSTKSPLVKIELDDELGLILNKKLRKQLNFVKTDDSCCLFNTVGNCVDKISLYHFFKYARVVEKIGNNPADKTKIDVAVCGLKNFIVQNDESVMDVNGPVYPFGARPKIIDFDAVNPADPPLLNRNLIGPNFYLGSGEIFFKKWEKLCVHLNWKDKPSDFNEHYKAYLKRNNFHDCVAPLLNNKTIYGLNECDFLVRLSLLHNGTWEEQNADRLLFSKEICTTNCVPKNNYDYSFFVQPGNFGVNNVYVDFDMGLKKLDVNSKYGFLKFNLRNQDFLHKDFAFVLARQMMAMGKFPDKGVEGAVYFGTGNAVLVFRDTGTKIVALEGDITNAAGKANSTNNNVINIDENATEARIQGSNAITNTEFNDPGLVAGNPSLSASIAAALANASSAKGFADAAVTKLVDLKQNISIFDFITGGGKLSDDLSVPIPNEPWTPIIKNIEVDYTATATIADIDIIHLYPYKDTYKSEEIELQPTLFPTFCDEGTMYIGLKQLVPGGNLNMLFQLAEATADSELEREEVAWHYLDNNQWKSLRKGFEVIDDATEELTTSGIIKFALPENMTNDNTILPKDLHWIKASIPRNSQSVSETIGIHTQAIQVVFTNEKENDKLRLDTPLPAGSVAKLKEADANIKKVEQPYDSFGGREPEVEKQYYVRASELLRHKGRAIQKWDYERIALEAFPQIYRVKCINHSFALNARRYINDFPVAPGYVLLAVIPDLTKLKAGNSFEPKAPVSLLEDINEYIRKRTSPFVRLKVMNPRYEKVEFCLKVKLYKGKDENYYKEKLKEDLREFLAPWAIGEYSKLSFGQCVNRSDLLRFMEELDYLDYVIDLKMKHAMDSSGIEMVGNQNEVCPNTPRSILVAGEIDVCIGLDNCDKWDERVICLNQPEKIIDYCKPVIIN